MVDYSHFKRWDLILMCIAMAYTFTMEMIGVFVPGKHYVTITYVIRSVVPMWLRWMLWGWLGWHFLTK